MKYLIIIFLFFTTLNAREVNLETLAKGYQKYQNEIIYYSVFYNLDYALVTTIIAYESGFNPKATYYGCNGLMQVKGGSFNPRKNIRQGCSILQRCFYLNDYDTVRAITSYNKGVRGAKRYKDTIKYTKDVLRTYNAVKILFNADFMNLFGVQK